MGSIPETTSSSTAPGIPLPIEGKTYFPFGRGLSVIKPLSRRGTGPGLLVLTNDNDDSGTIAIKNGFPSPALKWAEEGYTVVEIRGEAVNSPFGMNSIELALRSLQSDETCQPKDVVGVVAYDPKMLSALSAYLETQPAIKGYVVYDNAAQFTSSTPPLFSKPIVYHLAGKSTKKLQRTPHRTAYEYPSSTSHQFATPFVPEHFHPSNEAVSHTRSLTHLKKLMDGPYFDLEAIWDEHTSFEFADRSVEKTMATMVQEPYVNHIPTMTGGIGRERLTQFYRNHFIFNNPDDTELELVSRTVGIDRIIDEFVFKFEHNKMVDWMLPGIPPTYRRVEVPFTSVVNVRGDRLYHEHIAWDQANALRQLGLMPDYLPFPYPVPSTITATGDSANTTETEYPVRYEYRVPVAGVEAANKLRDKNSGESNLMFEYAIRECKD